MKYNFDSIPDFEKGVKKLSKKYKSLKEDLDKLQDEFITNPNLGKALGAGIRKIRLNITSKKTGKSGGTRVITHELLVKVDNNDQMSVLFLYIYDKSEYDTVDIDLVKEVVTIYRNLKEEQTAPTTSKKNASKSKTTKKSNR